MTEELIERLRAAMTQETDDVAGLIRSLEALAGDCDNTDGWQDAAPTVREAADALQSQSARIAELDALLERCARGFEKHARHWRASQARTDSLEDSVRAKNADALADLARSSLTKDSTSVTG